MKKKEKVKVILKCLLKRQNVEMKLIVFPAFVQLISLYSGRLPKSSFPQTQFSSSLANCCSTRTVIKCIIVIDYDEQLSHLLLITTGVEFRLQTRFRTVANFFLTSREEV